MKYKQIDEKTWVREMKIAGFVAVCKFWREASEAEDPVSAARSMLQVIAALAWTERNGVPMSPQEEESFRYCGMKPSVQVRS